MGKEVLDMAGKKGLEGKRSLEDRKSRLNEVNEVIKEKSARLKDLETSKKAIRKLRMAIENMEGLDSEAKAEGVAETNAAYEEISNEATTVSSEVGKSIKELDGLKQETDESLNAAKKAQKSEKKLMQVCSDKGVKVSDGGLDDNVRENQELLREIIKKMKNADNIAIKLDTL